MKPVVWSAAARRDANAAADWYTTEGGVPLGERFFEGLETAFNHIGRHPQTGSTRYAALLKLDELRFWPLKRFPYLVFYIEREIQVDVLRVLHAQRDIPEWIGASDSNKS